MGDTLWTLFVVASIFGTFILAVWLMGDAEARGKPGCLVVLLVLLVLLLNFPGLLIWLLFRPEIRQRDPAIESDGAESDAN